MKGYLFIYTRLDNFDYRLLYAPDTKFLPSPTRDTFINFAREVINTDNTGNGSIKSKRWSMIKRNNLILIGLGCYNNLLGYVESKNERRDIRGFFGIVFDSFSPTVSGKMFELDLYKDIFGNYVSPLWNLQKKDEFRTNSVIQEINIETYDKQNLKVISINDSSNVCRVHSDISSPYDLFSSALIKKETDFVFNLNNSDHVLSHSLYAFKNITIIGNVSGYDISLKPVFQKGEKVIETTEKVRKDGHRPNKSLSRKECELAEVADVIYQRLKRCGISTIDFLKALSARFGYSAQFVSEENDEEYSDSTPMSEKKEASKTNSQEDVLVSINKYNQNKKERNESISSLKEQFKKEGHVKIEPPTSLEEIADTELSETLDSKPNTIETLDDIIKDSNFN